jgi:hypothetical protein
MEPDGKPGAFEAGMTGEKYPLPQPELCVHHFSSPLKS